MSVTTDYHFAPIPEGVLYDRALSANAVRVYGCLMRHGVDATNCYPSRERIAEKVNMSVSTVKRSIAELIEQGWVERVERFDGEGAQTSNGYHIRATPLGHGRPAPRVTGEPPPGSPVTHEREPLKESQGKKTLTLLSESREAHDETPAAQKSLDAEFDDWYSGYPVKKSKGAARKAYRTARKKVDAETLIRGRDAFARLMKAQQVDKGYIKHPSTWLNGECWEDEEPEARDPFQGPEMRFG